MDFSGRLYFDFTSPDVYRIYRLLAAAQRNGANLQLEWRAFSAGPGAPDRRALAASELVRIGSPRRHGSFIQGMLAAVHVEGSDPADESLIAVVAHVAGLPAGFLASERLGDEGARALADTEREGRELGVTMVPSFYRHGPVMGVRTTPAAADGDALARLRLIDGMLDDDGLWELAKP